MACFLAPCNDCQLTLQDLHILFPTTKKKEPESTPRPRHQDGESRVARWGEGRDREGCNGRDTDGSWDEWVGIGGNSRTTRQPDAIVIGDRG